MGWKLCPKLIKKVGIHILKVIGNVKANYALSAKSVAKFSL